MKNNVCFESILFKQFNNNVVDIGELKNIIVKIYGIPLSILGKLLSMHY